MAGPTTPKAHETEAGAHTVAVEHGHGPTGPFPPFDKSTFGPQLIWLAITFGFLYFALARRLLPRLSGLIEGRADGIRRDLTEAERLKSETETSLKAYEQALAAAKANASGIAKAQHDTLAAETARERAAVDAQMAAKVAEAEKRITQSKQTALSAVSNVASDTVGEIVAKLTGQSVSPAEIQGAIAAVKVK